MNVLPFVALWVAALSAVFLLFHFLAYQDYDWSDEREKNRELRSMWRRG